MKKVLKYLAFVMLVLIVIVLLAFISNARLKGQENYNEPIFINKNNELVYVGKIDREGFRKLKDLYDKAEMKPSALIITSSGGEAKAGVDMGFWVYENKLSVEVTRYCFSSCANFIFTAGREKTLGKRAMLIWHGGAHQPNLFDQAENIVNNLPIKGNYQASYKDSTKCQPNQSKDDCKKHFERSLYSLKFNESLFFYKLGIDPNLPYYGQLPHYTRQMDITSYTGFYYSLEDLKKMGVLGIHVKGGGTWKPESNVNYKKAYKAEVLRDANIRTDADLGMDAFNEILRDYIALHGVNYSVPDLLNWYTYESRR